VAKRKNSSRATNVTTVASTPVGDLDKTDKQVANSGPLGVSLNTLNGVIYEQVREELKHEKGKAIYKQMMYDSAIEAPADLLRMVVGSAQWSAKVDKDAPKKEHKRADIINYMLSTMERPWSEYITESMSYLFYGFWPGEKVYGRDQYTPYGNVKYLLKDIVTISQDSVREWHFKKGTGELLGLVQDFTYINNDTKETLPDKEDVPRKKFIHLRNNPQRNNPEGKSMLDSVYMVWRYKCILEEYLEIGAIKDLSGIPIFKVDAAKMQEAIENPTSPEAVMITNLQNMIQGLHAGELNGGVIPIAYDENNNPMYDFKLLGIEGTGKQYDVLEIIKHYSMQITIRFFADILTIGSNGSHALSDNKMSLVRLACTHYLKTIKDTFNHDLIPQLYRLNGWDYNPIHSVHLDHSSVEEFSLDSLGAFIQKCVAVNAIRPGKPLEDILLSSLNMDPYNEETELWEPADTKHGEGLQEGLPGGTGGATGSSGDPATANVSG
jgi:hypothetical protein